MTNRRKATKSKTSTSKKSDTPEKHTRRLNRRSKRTRKSESPEPTEEGSDYSAVDDGTEDGEVKRINDVEKPEEDEEEYGERDGAQSDKSHRNTEEEKSKEDESGSSDGAWKVKSENGGGGGIPKLKLCLTRPPEMSSPTSEPSPGPTRRRRRTPRSATEEQSEEAVEEKEPIKRSTRSQRAREAADSESRVEEAPEYKTRESSPRSEVCDSTSLNHNLGEDGGETEIVDSVQSEADNAEVDEDKCESVGISEESAEKEKSEDDDPKEKESKDEAHIEEQEVNTAEKEEENEKEEEEEKEKEKEKEKDEEKEKEKEEEEKEKEEEEEEKEKEKHQEKQTDEAEDGLEDETRLAVESISALPADVEENVIQRFRDRIAKREAIESEVDTTSSEVPTKKDKEILPEISPEISEVITECNEEKQDTEVPKEDIEPHGSPSSDSSEERAKEAALLSRNKKKEGSEEGELVESPDSGIVHSRNEAVHLKVTSSFISTSTKEAKENHEEQIPVVRKRRWGSSAIRVSKKPSVSISTDFLKEIIPEVKPLPMNEVHLSPNEEEEEEGQLKDSEENLSVVAKKPEREKIVPSDESEKDYEEDALESGVEEAPVSEKVTISVKEKENATFTRKVSVLSSNELNRIQKSPSPPRHKPTNILYITNLVRPFTIPQLRELLARTGTIAENGFWIDKIKSRCYVKYETEEEAKVTRHALHGVRWPVSNPKQLNVDYVFESAMKSAQEGSETSNRTIPSLFDKAIDLKNADKTKEKEREERIRERREKNEREKRDRLKQKEDDRREEEEKDKKSRPAVEPLVRDRTVRRVAVPVREWDVGKMEDGFSPPPDSIEYSRHRDDRYERRVEYERDKRDDYDDRRRRDKDRGRRSFSGEPPRKSKKKSEDEAPAKLLDDLFRKTKATPCIYWLPLTSEQIAVKEEMRRKHMAEHEKRVAEIRKMQRDQSKRSSDKRRRRSKSRSRSRSPKK